MRAALLGIILVSSHLAAADPVPPWKGRAFVTGSIRGKSEHSTFTFETDKGKARLVIERRTADNTIKGDIGPWSAPFTHELTGTFDGTKLVLDDTDPKTPKDDMRRFEVECKKTKVAVAAATAVRIREGKDSCAGDQGKWSPAKTKKVSALVCGDPTAEGDFSFTVVDPKTPTIEYLWVNDDCVMQGGGYREIPKDASIAPPRAKPRT